MTSAQVVDVTTNSSSQDYTHAEDHNLPTYDMTPELKPFTALRSFGRKSKRLANDYISYAINVRRLRQQLWFNYTAPRISALFQPDFELSPPTHKGPYRLSKPPADNWSERGLTTVTEDLTPAKTDYTTT